MSANYYHLPGGGSESRPLYPLSWWEGGKYCFYDGSDEHIPHDVLPPGLRELYRASMAARRAADEARWQEFLKRKCP